MNTNFTKIICTSKKNQLIEAMTKKRKLVEVILRSNYLTLIPNISLGLTNSNLANMIYKPKQSITKMTNRLAKITGGWSGS